MNTHKVSLEEMLDQREKRAYQLEAVKKEHPDKSIISFKLNIPGDVKNDDDLLYAFESGLKQLIDYKLIIDERFNKTGPEAILIGDDDKNSCKEKMILIEENFPLGRLYDLDVLESDRQSLKMAPRKCLICEDEAHACSRSRKHGLDEVISKIYTMIREYKDVER